MSSRTLTNLYNQRPTWLGFVLRQPNKTIPNRQNAYCISVV